MLNKHETPSPREIALSAPVVVAAALLQIKLMGPAVWILSLGLIAAYAIWAVVRLNSDSTTITLIVGVLLFRRLFNPIASKAP